MSHYKYKKILPEDVYVTASDREATEEELWQGIPRDFHGNRPSGNDFMDTFACLVRVLKHVEISVYAKEMGVSTSDLGGAVRAMSGITAVQWRDRYLVLIAREYLEKTSMPIGQIGVCIGFNSPECFSRFFKLHTGKQPFEYRSTWDYTRPRKYHF